MSDTESTDVLIQSAVQGDPVALERLLLDHYVQLTAHLSKRMPVSLLSVTSVEDIVQQTFAQVFQGIRDYEQRTGDSFMAWLASIAENRLRDELRAQKRKKRGGEFARVRGFQHADESSVVLLLDAVAGKGHTASQSLARREAIQAIQVAVAGLPPDYQEAIQLHYFEGHTLEETAALMDCSTGAIRGLLDRSRKKLRQALERASHYLSSK